eukprot:15362535-Ditylum_brightwellii.AAC.1
MVKRLPRVRRGKERVGGVMSMTKLKIYIQAQLPVVIISIDGQQHTVDVLYISEPVPDYVTAIAVTGFQICIDKFDVADNNKRQHPKLVLHHLLCEIQKKEQVMSNSAFSDKMNQ